MEQYMVMPPMLPMLPSFEIQQMLNILVQQAGPPPPIGKSKKKARRRKRGRGKGGVLKPVSDGAPCDCNKWKWDKKDLKCKNCESIWSNPKILPVHRCSTVNCPNEKNCPYLHIEDDS